MPKFRSLPGFVQLLLAIAVMGVFVVLAHWTGLAGGWATLVGIFAGALVLTLWEGFGSGT